MKKLIIIALIVSIITGFAVFQFATSLQKGADQKTQPVVIAAEAFPRALLFKKKC